MEKKEKDAKYKKNATCITLWLNVYVNGYDFSNIGWHDFHYFSDKMAIKKNTSWKYRK